jgi:hypothetical protein
LNSCFSIINAGPGIEIGLELFQFVLDDFPGNFTIGVIQVPKFPNPGHAGSNAGRFFPFFNKTQTKAAFFNIALFFYYPDVIRAGHNAIFAADALVRVYEDDPIFPLVRSPRRADLYAGRIVAMLALNRDELPVVLRKRTVLPFLQMVV